jgi:hypothetical protein
MRDFLRPGHTVLVVGLVTGSPKNDDVNRIPGQSPPESVTVKGDANTTVGVAKG